jgi:cytochrome oxidase Cu insertion factor (SCO1/SenC/PrrC family)
MHPDRRQALKIGLGTVAAMAVGARPLSASPPVSIQEQNELQQIKKDFEATRQLQQKKPVVPKDSDTLQAVFKDMPLTDQYGKPFNPAELFAKGPVLVMFGRNVCDMCEKIGVTAAAIQKEMSRKNVNIPIIVVSVMPEKDRFHEGESNPMREYVERYARQNVRQFPENISYDAGKNKPQKDRILHIVCTPKQKFPESKYNYPQTLQNRVGELFKGITNVFDPSTEESHSQYITLFNDGRASLTLSTLPIGNKEVPGAVEAHAEKCAKLLVHEATQPVQGHTR